MWDNNDLNPVHSKTIENKAAHFRIFINAMAGQNAELASCILRNLQKKLFFIAPSHPFCGSEVS
jgi:hypothetical protein